MATWYVITRFEQHDLSLTKCDDCGKIHEKCVYPQEGIPILIYNSKERAEEVNKGNGSNFKIVEVTIK